MAITVASGASRNGRPDLGRPVSSRLPPHWPLAALFVGFPLWWVLGLSVLMPILLAVPMAIQLLRQRTIALPRGFGWWLLFLLIAVLSVAVLWVDAPGAVPGGGAERLLVFGYRIGWYVACTVALLWVVNLDRRLVTDAMVMRLVGWMFVVATAGGLLGLAAPGLEFRSLVELMLPGGLRGNSFVSSLVHPEAADVQTVLGRPETRPKAPFAFTNSWGSALSLSLVFFLVALRRSNPRILVAAAAVLVTATVPIFYSLNRGLWASLALGACGMVLLQLARARLRTVVALVLAGTVIVGVLLASPLGAIYQERLDNQHSNDRRSQLLDATVQSVTRGSPVLGFGNTRDVQGSFASITGAATPACPACGVPPLGTQGHLWLVLFSQGWFGAAFFLMFFVLALARSVRCRTVAEVTCTFVVAFFLLQLSIYDTLGLPMYMVMVAIGLVARERLAEGSRVQERPTPRALATSHALLRELRQGVPVLVSLAMLGGVAGWYVALHRSEPVFTARVSIALTPSPVYLDAGAAASATGVRGARAPREITVDTEAALLLSERTLGEAVGVAGGEPEELRRAISLTAPPNSHVLDVTVSDRWPERAQRLSGAVAEAYLHARRAYLEQQREDLIGQLQDEYRRLEAGDASTSGTRTYLVSAITHLRSSSPSVGEVIRHGEARPRRKQPEVQVASGIAIGLLLALTITALRRRP